jgi:hypothetical protein
VFLSTLTGSPGALAGTVVCSYSGTPTASGTLTKSSGTGDATIVFSAFAPSPDSTIVTSLILKADTYIDNALNGVYDVPFTTGSQSSITTPAFINKLSIDLSCYYAFQRRPNEYKIGDDWNKIYKDCIESIDRLANLDDVLNDATPIYVSGKIVNVTTTPYNDFENSDNQISNF